MQGRLSRSFSVSSVAGAVAGLVFLGGAVLAQPTMQRLPAAQPTMQRLPDVAQPIQQAAGGPQGFALFKKGLVRLGAGGGGQGLDAGWIARLDLPNGKYIVSASAKFTRDSPNSRLPFDEETPQPDTASVDCELGGLDQTATVDFYIDAALTDPRPSVTVPFNVAGTSTGGGVFLRCNPPTGQVLVSNIAITAVRVSDLTVRNE